MCTSGTRHSLARPWWKGAAATCVTAFLSTACAHGPAATQPTPAQPPSANSSATTVSSAEITRAPSQSIEQYLSDKVSGVDVDRSPDGGISVRIRGASSFQGNNEPLYVIDGVITNAGPNGGLSGINPYDIASIRVLKDATDLTMYGARGANGVILITTKHNGPPLNE